MELVIRILSFYFFTVFTHNVLANTQSLIDKELKLFQNVYNYGQAEVIDEVINLTSTDNFFLLTQKSYKNFILNVEVKMPDVTEYSNSGIIFRAQLKPTKDGYQEAVGYQAEVDPSGRKWSGGLYDQARREWLHPSHPRRSHPDHHFVRNLSPSWSAERSNAYKTDQWNQYRIECRGSNIKIYLNDILTTHIIDTKDQQGLIGLQHHGSEELRKLGKTHNIVRFRNLTIKELD